MIQIFQFMLTLREKVIEIVKLKSINLNQNKYNLNNLLQQHCIRLTIKSGQRHKRQ